MKILTNMLLLVCMLLSLELPAQLPDSTLETSLGLSLSQMHETLKKIEAGVCPEQEAKKFTLAVGLFDKASTQEIQNLSWDLDAYPFDRNWDGRLEITPESVVLIRRGFDDMELKVKEYERDNVSGLFTFGKGAWMIKKHCDFIFLNVEGLDSKTVFRDLHKLCDQE